MKLRDQILAAGYDISITINSRGISGFLHGKGSDCEYIPTIKDMKTFYNICLNFISEKQISGERC